MELITPAFGLFFWTLVVFIILFFVLKKFAWKPIMNAIQEREDHIENSLAAAKKAKEEVAQLKSDNEQILAEARMERERILKEAREAKDAMINEAKEHAQTEADKIISQARETIQNEKNAAVVELKNHVADMAISIAERVVSNNLESNDEQKKLISSLMQEMN